MFSNRKFVPVFSILSPSFDVLFDLGLISFSDEGDILISSEIEVPDLEKLGVDKSSKLAFVYPENKPYLDYHRKLNRFD